MRAFTTDDFERAIAAFAAAPFDSDRWTDALDLLGLAAGGWSGQLLGVSPDGAIRFNIVTNMPDDATAEWERRGGGMVGVNPRALSILTEPFQITADDDYLDRNAQEASPFYQEIFTPFDARFMAVGRLANHGDTSAVVGAIRTKAQGHVQREDQERLTQLLPHADAAVALHLQLGGQMLSASLATLEIGGTAALFCDHWGRVIGMTAAADALLRDDALLRLRGGRLHATQARADERLQQALRRASLRPGERGTAVRQSMFALVDAEGHVRRVDVAPVPPGRFPFSLAAALLVTIAPAPAPAEAGVLLQEAFGLTRAEAAIALDLAHGLGAAEIAVQRGRSPATVRVQIRSLLAKMDISKATAVAAIVGRLSG
ncbi:MAG: LuxR C-terminal-related transcriptional regulator [Sphingobium sp.]